MRISERILRAFSRRLDQPEYYVFATEKWNISNALDYARKAHPTFISTIKDRDVLDYGCGPGWQTVALALAGARSVAGVDITKPWIEHARKLIHESGVGDRAAIVSSLSELGSRRFDVILSQDSFEHYHDPAQVIQDLRGLLKPGGRIFLVFTGPWYSPWGSHMQVFTPLPWVNILFPESVVMRVRSDYRHDGATRYEDIEGGLNKMTVARFNKIMAGSGMKVENMFYRGFKGMNFMRFLPVLRELFADQLGCILTNDR